MKTYFKQENARYLRFRDKIGFHERILVPNDTRILNAPASTYRGLPKSLIGNITYQMYGDRICFIIFEQRRVIILRHPPLTDIFRAQFDVLWGHAKPLRSP